MAEASNSNGGSSDSQEPPPLPPRPTRRLQSNSSSFLSPARSGSTNRASSPGHLQARATTALSLEGVQALSIGDDDEIASVKSTIYNNEGYFEAESMLGDVLEKHALPWTSSSKKPELPPGPELFPPDSTFDGDFDDEFNELDDITSDGLNEEAVIRQWKSKMKHYFILSRAGKPVWTRHGNDQIVTSYIGVILTLLSFYEGVGDSLKGFTAGNTRFVVLSKGSLHLVAISRIGESDQQLRNQLEALYMQVLSTLTLPVMERMYKVRASTDLRRSLQGTERLLSALADGFTRGSTSTLLSALECLKMRKSHRQVIDSTLLKAKSENLLYGIIATGGRLISVVRPRKHSLHTGDLHIIFNMLFESGRVKAGEGENWVPLCLPGFNNTGYVYMYVSFLDLNNKNDDLKEPIAPTDTMDQVAVILISANQEAFFELQEMKNKLVDQLYRNGSLRILNHCIKIGRPTCSEVLPSSPVQHFLYRSRTNVQFTKPSYEPHFSSLVTQRKLITTYAALHSAMHAKGTAGKILHSVTPTCTAFAWITQAYELYLIAPSGTSREELSAAANKVVQYVNREVERLFILGGAVF